MEIYVTIPNYSNYLVSNYGNIKTFNWKNKGIEAVMKPAKDKSGYLRTMLKNDSGKYDTIKVHRIVVSAFIGLKDGLEVNHKDGVKTNNNIDNLELVTHQENMKHAFKNKLQDNLGSKNPFSKLNEKKVIEIRSKFKKHVYTRQMLATEYNVTIACIKDILIKRTWAHV
jgi:hypothetical protein